MADALEHDAPAPSPAVAEVLALPELVHAITALVGDGDTLSWALACRGFRAAQVQVRLERAPRQQLQERKILSPAREFLSKSRVAWVMTGGMHGGHMVLQHVDQRRFCGLAAKLGGLECLQTLRSGGFVWRKQDMCVNAAAGGQLEVLQLLREEGCPWDAGTCSSAAAKGHLDVLRWAREQGCPWDAWTCSNAAAKGLSCQIGA